MFALVGSSPTADKYRLTLYIFAAVTRGLTRFEIKNMQRLPGFHAFYFHWSFTSAPVAQWIARWTSNPKVAGSSPARGVFGNDQKAFSELVRH